MTEDPDRRPNTHWKGAGLKPVITSTWEENGTKGLTEGKWYITLMVPLIEILTHPRLFSHHSKLLNCCC